MEHQVNLNNTCRQPSRSDLFDHEIPSAVCRARSSFPIAARSSVWILCLIFAPAAIAGAAEAGGIHGTVSLSPSCPGAQVEGGNCRAPYSDAQLRLMALDGSQVAAGSSSASGRFQLMAPAGRYRLQVTVPAKPVRCPVTEVVVTETRSTLVDIDCDSGMR